MAVAKRSHALHRSTAEAAHGGLGVSLRAHEGVSSCVLAAKVQQFCHMPSASRAWTSTWPAASAEQTSARVTSLSGGWPAQTSTMVSSEVGLSSESPKAMGDADGSGTGTRHTEPVDTPTQI